MNELDSLAEDREQVLARVPEKARGLDRRKLERAVSRYGKSATQKYFRRVLQPESVPDAAIKKDLNRLYFAIGV